MAGLPGELSSQTNARSSEIFSYCCVLAPSQVPVPSFFDRRRYLNRASVLWWERASAMRPSKYNMYVTPADSNLVQSEAGVEFAELFVGAWLGSSVAYWTSYALLSDRSGDVQFLASASASIPGSSIGLWLAGRDSGGPTIGESIVSSSIGTLGGFVGFLAGYTVTGALGVANDSDLEIAGSVGFLLTQSAIAAWITN